MITVKRIRGRRNVYFNGRHIGLIQTRIKDQARHTLEYVYTPTDNSPIPAHYSYNAPTIREIVVHLNRHVRSALLAATTGA